MSSTGEHFTPNPSDSMIVIQPQLESVQPQTSQPLAIALPFTAASITVFTEVNHSKKRGKVFEVWAHFKGLKIMTLRLRLLSTICIVMLLILGLVLMGLLL